MLWSEPTNLSCTCISSWWTLCFICCRFLEGCRCLSLSIPICSVTISPVHHFFIVFFSTLFYSRRLHRLCFFPSTSEKLFKTSQSIIVHLISCLLISLLPLPTYKDKHVNTHTHTQRHTRKTNNGWSGCWASSLNSKGWLSALFGVIQFVSNTITGTLTESFMWSVLKPGGPRLETEHFEFFCFLRLFVFSVFVSLDGGQTQRQSPTQLNWLYGGTLFKVSQRILEVICNCSVWHHCLLIYSLVLQKTQYILISTLWISMKRKFVPYNVI